MDNFQYATIMMLLWLIYGNVAKTKRQEKIAHAGWIVTLVAWLIILVMKL